MPGKVTAEQVVKISGAKALNGQQVDIKVNGSKVLVDEANVVATDIVCTNGVIHVIDAVILPAADNIPATAEKAGSFKTLLAAVKAAGLAEVLSGKGPFHCVCTDGRGICKAASRYRGDTLEARE